MCFVGNFIGVLANMLSNCVFFVVTKCGLVGTSDGSQLEVQDVKPTLKIFLLWNFLFFSILCTVASVGVDLLTSDLNNSWFQRSGSILVVAALLVKTQLRLIWEHKLMWTRFYERAGLTANDLEELIYNTDRFDAWNNVFNTVASYASFLGTFIWGYGDYLFP